MTTNRHLRAASGRLGPVPRVWVVPLALVPLLLLVPAGLGLCDPAVEACALAVPVAPVGAHCPMEALEGAGGSESLECCVRDVTLPVPSPAAPAKADSDLRAPFQILAPAPVAPPAEAALPAVPSALAPAAAPIASAVPLYTLLSTLLN